MAFVWLDGEIAAVVGRRRFYLLPHIERLDRDDRRRGMVLAKAVWALEVSGPERYDDQVAERFLETLLEEDEPPRRRARRPPAGRRRGDGGCASCVPT
jgi:hypothetical protein